MPVARNTEGHLDIGIDRAEPPGRKVGFGLEAEPIDPVVAVRPAQGQQVADPPVAIGPALGHKAPRTVLLRSVKRHGDIRGRSALRDIQHVRTQLIYGVLGRHPHGEKQYGHRNRHHSNPLHNIRKL